MKTFLYLAVIISFLLPIQEVLFCLVPEQETRWKQKIMLTALQQATCRGREPLVLEGLKCHAHFFQELGSTFLRWVGGQTA